MKKRTFIISLFAVLLAIQPSVAEENNYAKFGGITVAGLGATIWFLADKSATDFANDSICVASGTVPEGTTSYSGVCSPNDHDGDKGEKIAGILMLVGGSIWAYSGFTDNSASFTQNGLVMDGLTFGYTDTGKVGLQKKWDF